MKTFITQIAFLFYAVIGCLAQTTADNTSVQLPDFDVNTAGEITGQPVGETRYYNRAGFELSMDSGSPIITNQSGLMCVVFGDDNEVWIKNPISNDIRETWVKGRMLSDHTTITVPTGQFIDYMPTLTFGRQLWVLDYNSSIGTYVVNPAITEITYTIADGVLTLQGTSRNRVIGSVFRAKGETEEEYHYEGTWSGYGNYESVYTPYADAPCSVPVGSKSERFTFRAPVSSSGQWCMNVLEATISSFGDDIYLSGFCSSGYYFTNLYWSIKGYRQDGNLIFPSGQFLGTYYDNPYYLCGKTSEKSSDECDIVFVISENGQYITDTFLNFVSTPKSDSPYFYYDGATLSKQSLPELVTPPVSARPHLFKMSYKGYIQSIDFYYDSSINITVAATDSKVYIKGLYFALPDAWVEGDIIGDKVVFASTQYLGFLNEQNPEMWFMAFGQQFDKPLDKIEFDYDHSTGALSNPSANISISICDRRNLGLQWFFEPSMEMIEVTPATPANPENLEWQTYEWDSSASFIFEIPQKDIMGNDIVKNWLYYRIYTETNGQESLFVMEPEVYPEMDLTESLDIFPYNYRGYDITFAYNRIYFSIRGDWTQYNRIGVQSIYDAGGVENTSDIVWITLPQSGISEVISEDCAEKHNLYNMQGQLVKGKPSPGIYIRNGKKIVIR